MWYVLESLHINTIYHSCYTVTLNMKGCIAHFTKWQIHPFISKVMIHLHCCCKGSVPDLCVRGEKYDHYNTARMTLIRVIIDQHGKVLKWHLLGVSTKQCSHAWRRANTSFHLINECWHNLLMWPADKSAAILNRSYGMNFIIHWNIEFTWVMS